MCDEIDGAQRQALVRAVLGYDLIEAPPVSRVPNADPDGLLTPMVTADERASCADAARRDARDGMLLRALRFT